MKPFCKLTDPSRYVSDSWDLTVDAEGREWWVRFFMRHFVKILELAVDVATSAGEDKAAAQARAEKCREAFHAHCEGFLARPTEYGRVNVVTLDQWRDGTLRRFGFPDAFLGKKEDENAKMLPLLPKVCRQLDALSGREQARAVIDGVFAGNIFDLGSEATAKSFMDASPDFFHVREKLSPRPWLIDDLDALLDRLMSPRPYRTVAYFIDNAGSDFLLGALPMMRWLAQRGTHVVLAANELATLNDMTIHDVRRWWPRILETEPSLRGLPIEPVSTGTAEPLLDLLAVSDELNAACTDADLVILEGMGRSIESNIDVQMTCDSLNIGMIKMDVVAKRMGGKLYDLVCRFRSGR